MLLLHSIDKALSWLRGSVATGTECLPGEDACGSEPEADVLGSLDSHWESFKLGRFRIWGLGFRA